MSDKFANFGEAKSLDRPYNKAWGNFAKFEKAGDSQKGILVDVFYKAAEGKFPEQRGFTLDTEDGLTNVAIKNKPDFAVESTNNVRIGDLLTITLTELKPAKEKGYNPAKIYGFESASPADDSNAGNKTVLELLKEEMKAVGVEHVADEAEAPAQEEAEEVPFKDGE